MINNQPKIHDYIWTSIGLFICSVLKHTVVIEIYIINEVHELC